MMAISASNEGIFSKLFSVFKSRDPLRREIFQSASIIDRLLRSLEASRKNLEAAIDEHKKRLKIQGDDKELAKIIDEEIKNIYGYLSMITKTVYDLARVKYRLETLFYVEEPLKILPEVLEELRSVEPIIEKINPQLINQIKALEQRVASIMAMSSSYIPGISSVPQQLASSLVSSSVKEQKQVRNVSEEIANANIGEKSLQVPTSNVAKRAEPERKAVNASSTKKAELVQVPTLSEKQKVGQGNLKEITEDSKATIGSGIPLNVIEQWILNELKISSGILDIKLFEKKYGVKRDAILEALRSLEAKNTIRVRRK